ncbi:hypothetical protein LshimejAT787_1104240 [Lyophyllum shimeji]|uniref:Uncharacterized protein n=1 Tax=Lyophyllum shimeji TaxID=47721 RepID=A0A9P3PUE0_LYOSH|nr:hypothetical protein LshimejAT787_1003630 [Lyophyllum shimeji]GLB42409.1 hypothetical protein LshimejAT787_1104240 [Lyophyllum shimeji]
MRFIDKNPHQSRNGIRGCEPLPKWLVLETHLRRGMTKTFRKCSTHLAHGRRPCFAIDSCSTKPRAQETIGLLFYEVLRGIL